MSTSKELSVEVVKHDAVVALAHCGLDPVEKLARYALGDVVSLGLMTREELEAEAEYDEDGLLVMPSGRDRALNVIPPRIRVDALKELAQYVYAKKVKGEPDFADIEDPIQIYIPDNGRGRP